MKPKECLVATGNLQTKGADYLVMFSTTPVVSWIGLIAALALKYDVKVTFCMFKTRSPCRVMMKRLTPVSLRDACIDRRP